MGFDERILGRSKSNGDHRSLDCIYKEMQQVRTKERQKEELRTLHDQALDMLDEFANEYHISDDTVFALKGDFERAFRKLSEIHHDKGENNGNYAHPTVE